jgi:hypothetical protein
MHRFPQAACGVRAAQAGECSGGGDPNDHERFAVEGRDERRDGASIADIRERRRGSGASVRFAAWVLHEIDQRLESMQIAALAEYFRRHHRDLRRPVPQCADEFRGEVHLLVFALLVNEVCTAGAAA